MVRVPGCRHWEAGHCKLVEELAGKPCPVTTECKSCTQDINLVTLTLASRLTPEREYDISLLGHGFGTRLSNLLGNLGIRSLSGVCDCGTHKDILDLWTPDYIRQNIDQVVEWLAREAGRRRLPFSYRLTRFLLLRLLK